MENFAFWLNSHYYQLISCFILPSIMNKTPRYFDSYGMVVNLIFIVPIKQTSIQHTYAFNRNYPCSKYTDGLLCFVILC